MKFSNPKHRRPTVDKYSPCPCGTSSKKAKWCCWTARGTWEKKPVHVFPPPPVTGVSNPKCYANSTNDCSDKIQREHYVSEQVLHQIAEGDPKQLIQVAGMPWQAPETLTPLRPNATAVGRVLCTRHGDALHQLDDHFGGFFRLLETIDDALRDGTVDLKLSVFSGRDLERWMLKMLLGGTTSGNIPGHTRKECVELLYGLREWPAGWGLYVPSEAGTKVWHSTSYREESFVNSNTGEVLMTQVVARGIPIRLVMGKPDGPGLGTFRPRTLVFTKGPIEWHVELGWPDDRLQEFVSYDRDHTYEGHPVDYPEWIKALLPVPK